MMPPGTSTNFTLKTGTWDIVIESTNWAKAETDSQG